MEKNIEQEIAIIVDRLDIASDDRQALSKDIGALWARTSKLDGEGSIVAAGVSDLSGRVSALEDSGKPKANEPPPAFANDGFGILRNTATGVVVDLSVGTYRDRQLERLAESQLEEAELHKRLTDGLPPGCYRDPCGIVRGRDGRVARIVTTDEATAYESTTDRNSEARQLVYESQKAGQAEAAAAAKRLFGV